MNKFKILKKEYGGSRVITGSPTLFFFAFWCTKVISFLQQRSDPLNRLIHSIVRYLPQPAFIIKNNTGVFLVRPFDDSTTICSDYFEIHLRSWLKRPGQKDIFLDIGANRGLYTVLALTKYGYRKAHAFEPNPDVVTLLKKNIALNDITDRTQIHTMGLGNAEEIVGFAVDDMHKGGGRVAEQDATAALTVSIKPLDMMLDATDIPRISFIKIDTEGYEFAVLEGAARTLTAMPETSCIMIESADPARVAAALAPHGFTQEASVAHDHFFIKK